MTKQFRSKWQLAKRIEDGEIDVSPYRRKILRWIDADEFDSYDAANWVMFHPGAEAQSLRDRYGEELPRSFDDGADRRVVSTELGSFYVLPTGANAAMVTGRENDNTLVMAVRGVALTVGIWHLQRDPETGQWESYRYEDGSGYHRPDIRRVNDSRPTTSNMDKAVQESVIRGLSQFYQDHQILFHRAELARAGNELGREEAKERELVAALKEQRQRIYEIKKRREAAEDIYLALEHAS